MTRFLRPREFSQALRHQGIELSVATLATKRSRTPEAIPFKKILGRPYYPWPEAYVALTGEPGTELAAAG